MADIPKINVKKTLDDIDEIPTLDERLKAASNEHKVRHIIDTHIQMLLTKQAMNILLSSSELQSLLTCIELANRDLKINTPDDIKENLEKLSNEELKARIKDVSL